MTTGTLVQWGQYEKRAALLMRDADCTSAVVVAVTELGHIADTQAALIQRLEARLDRLEAQPRPPVAREQMAFEVAR